MAKGWKSIPALLILAMILALGVFVSPATAGDPTSKSGDGPPGGPTQEAIGDTDALLIQDNAPWGFNPNHAVLDEFGVSYDVIRSQSLPTHNLGRLRFIMFASDQRTSYYQNIAANRPKIEDWVRRGGLLIAHCADDGWNGGSWQGFSILPGGITRFQDFPQTIEIIDQTHGVVTGCGAFTLTNDYLSGWLMSSHG